MRWEAPTFVEIKMDAEIGSYQDDFGDPPDITPCQNTLTAGETGSGTVNTRQATSC